jgi:hypothetical protein
MCLVGTALGTSMKSHGSHEGDVMIVTKVVERFEAAP